MTEITPFLMELFVYVALLVIVGYAIVFGYHWYKYGTKDSYATWALSIFLGGALLCLTLMFLTSRYVG